MAQDINQFPIKTVEFSIANFETRVSDAETAAGVATTAAEASQTSASDSATSAGQAAQAVTQAQEAAQQAEDMQRQFPTRQALIAYMQANPLNEGDVVHVRGIAAVKDSSATGNSSALRDLGVNGIRLDGSEIFVRWWTDEVATGNDTSSAIVWANTYAKARYAGTGGQGVKLTFEGRVPVANQVKLGPDSPFPLKTFSIDATACVFQALATGNLAAGDKVMFEVVNCQGSDIQFGTMDLFHLCGGASFERCVNSDILCPNFNRFAFIGVWSKGAKTIPDAGTNAGAIFRRPSGVEWRNTDPEFADSNNFVATGFRNDSHDIRVELAHIGWCGLPIHNKAGSCEYISCHPFNGNATGVGERINPMGILNEGNSGVNFYNTYGDNGYIIDLGGGLRINGLQMLDYNSTMQKPYVRLTTSGVDVAQDILNSIVEIGYITGTYDPELFTKGNVPIGSLVRDAKFPLTDNLPGAWSNIYETYGAMSTIIHSIGTPDYTTTKFGNTAGQQIVEKRKAGTHSANAAVKMRYGNGKCNTQTDDGNSGFFGVSMVADCGISSVDLPGVSPLLMWAGGAPQVRIQDNGWMRPEADNTQNLGIGSHRWQNIFAGTGTINTSDARNKQDITDIDDAVLDAWGDVHFTAYRWKDSVADKGEDARLHHGLIAQRIQDVFVQHDLNPFNYGLLCYDQWDDQADVLSPEGELVVPGVKAGDRYGVRYEQALCVEAAYQRRRADRIEARLAALEGKN